MRSAVLGRPVGYRDVPLKEWIDHDLRPLGLPDQVFQHISTMARRHAENRYDREADGVERVTGRSPSGVADFVRTHADWFTGP
ncbi:hypothetical protein ACWY4P_48445 [Streptomyces sp. LZ34]